MKQLTPKIQMALLNAGFEPRIDRHGLTEFIALNEQLHEVTAAAVGDLIVVNVRANGFINGRHLDAAHLDTHTDEALGLMFETILTFA